MNLGFYSPFHPIPGISSAQYDLSWEQHLQGTDMSFKLTPFYTWVNDWQQQTFIGAGFVTQVPVGVNRNYGVEFQFNKGDFSRNGLSGQFAFTYTNSKVMFQNVGLSTGGTVTNATIALNQVIAQYNALTKSGGGSPCYQGLSRSVLMLERKPRRQARTRSSTPTTTRRRRRCSIRAAGITRTRPRSRRTSTRRWARYISPEVASLILNCRHDKLAITPSFTFQTGGFYGSPLDINGYDPRTCAQNSAATGITKVSPKTNPLQCDVLTVMAPGFGPQGFLYIPDPQTGTFAFDNYQNPSSLVGNLQVTYDLSPKIRLTHARREPLPHVFRRNVDAVERREPPSNVICGYTPAGGLLNSTLYPSNFYQRHRHQRLRRQ